MKSTDEIQSIDQRLAEIDTELQPYREALARAAELGATVDGAAIDSAALAEKRKTTLADWLLGKITKADVDAEIAERKKLDAKAEQARLAREMATLGAAEIQARMKPLQDEAGTLGRRRNTLLRVAVRESAESVVPRYLAAMQAAGSAYAELQAHAELLNAAEHVGYSNAADFQRDGKFSFGGSFGPTAIDFPVFSALPGFEACAHGVMQVNFSRRDFAHVKNHGDHILIEIEPECERLRRQFADLGLTF